MIAAGIVLAAFASLPGTGSSSAAPGSAAIITSTATAVSPDVVARSANQDGSVTETSYTPAPGVSYRALAGMLAKRGVQGIAAESATASATTAFTMPQCRLGTARTWASAGACFVRWSANRRPEPAVVFRNRASSAWPVSKASAKWNETSGLAAIYRPYSMGCPGNGVHCVIVSSGNYGKSGWTGSTTRVMNSAQTYYVSASARLNDYYGGTLYQKWNTSCHELGHILGLDHNTSTSSCLYATRTSQRYPNSYDFGLLERFY